MSIAGKWFGGEPDDFITNRGDNDLDYEDDQVEARRAPVPMFVDAEAMKDKLRKSMLKPKYDVSSFYKNEGFCQLVARSQKFEYSTLAVIALNALWIAVDTDLNRAEMLLDAEPVFQIAEHFFCSYFTFEWVVRFGAFKRKLNGLRDAWFVFDSFMVVMMVGETWVMSILLLAVGSGGGGGLGNASILRLLRLLRLSRMARMAKLLRSMPELLILIKGMVSAMRSVIFTLLLLGILLYVFAIAFRQLTADTPVGILHFGSIFGAMHTLLLDGTLLDGTGTLVRALEEVNIGLVLLFYFFVLLAALTVMNMLIGVLCEVVSAVAATEREQIVVSTVKDGIMEIINTGGLDTNGDNQISKSEFVQMLDNPDACRLLTKVDVDVDSLVDLADFIFTNDDEEDEDSEKHLTFEEFMDIVLSLRGCNQAMVKDIVDLRKFIKTSLRQLEDKLRDRGMVRMSARTSVCPTPILSLSLDQAPGPLVPGQVGSPRQKQADAGDNHPVFYMRRGSTGSIGNGRLQRPVREAPLPQGSPDRPPVPVPCRPHQPPQRDVCLQAIKLEGVLSSAHRDVESFMALLHKASSQSSQGGAVHHPEAGSPNAGGRNRTCSPDSSPPHTGAQEAQAPGGHNFLRPGKSCEFGDRTDPRALYVVPPSWPPPEGSRCGPCPGHHGDPSDLRPQMARVLHALGSGIASLQALREAS
mmetsp:Transcript_41434/g.118266  ORF Transcript_41434/g.118266 Transcript_41434/m.118266 type:complete len:696 (-) Transcript_41434:239-2326(-)